MAKKTKTKAFSFQGFDAQHYKTTEQYAAAVDALFDRATKAIADAAAKGTYNPEKPFSFDDHPSVKAYAQKIITGLANNITSVVTNGSRKQWLFACQKNDEFVNSIIDTSKVSKARLNKMQDRNLDAMKTFQGRKVDGMNLSERVWKYTQQFKAQIELGLDVGLGEGRSAQQLSRDLRQNLQDPDRLFRRVRDKRGNLQLSKAAKAFHPGIGVYRSSAKNAARLTRSEINMAYREADWMRWQQLDFVVGFEVHRSNREPRFKCTLCDKLVGRYPKTFKFKGWHPQCMCYATAILMDENDFDKQELSDLKSALRGTEYKKLEVKNEVTDMPDGFKEWVAENQQKQSNWGSTPYFVKDNFKGGLLSKGLTFATKDVPRIDLIAIELQSIQAEFNASRVELYNWVYIGDIYDAIEAKNPTLARSLLDKKRIEMQTLKTKYNEDLSDARQTIIDAIKLKLDVSDMQKWVGYAQADSREWIMGNFSFKKALLNLKNAIKEASTPKGISMNMPTQFKASGDYLKGEDYTFEKQFFDLIDPEKPILLALSKANKGAYYSPSKNKVYIYDAARNEKSAWERKAVVYHEFGHGIDWQRDLRNSQEVAGMRAIQIARLKKQGTYKVWTRRYDYAKGKYVNEQVERKMSLVAYIDQKMQAISSKVWGMNAETFTKRGITKADVLEQIGSVRDTIKSLVITYGDGHSTKYFKIPGMSEAEYLAHAFENAFVGNEVFQKYMPDTYKEMVAYIRGLK